MSISRRAFLQTLLATAGASALPAAQFRFGGDDENDNLPRPSRSGIEHVVVVTMENRSFDHFLGWLPRSNGRQGGLDYLDRDRVAHPTHPLAPDYQGCAHPDPDHSYEGGRVEYDGGRCDGWLRAGSNDDFSIGYYGQSDLAFLGQAAPQWTTCDRYFAAIMAETYPNRIYTHAAQTDRLQNTMAISTLPTIWDRLAARGVSGTYYYSDVPFLALWGALYLPISRPFPAFLVACLTGDLPAVSYVDPRFIDEESGTSGDDHPHADIRDGEAFLNIVYTAVTRSPAWENTVLVITFDEWGGFFDHVPPGRAPIPRADRMAGNEDGLRGFRVPCLIVSPFAPRATVTHRLLDHTSILSMIEWRWGLPPLTIRDATATNLATVLDRRAPTLDAPVYDVPFGPFTTPCGLPVPDKWTALRDLARVIGWPV